MKEVFVKEHAIPILFFYWQQILYTLVNEEISVFERTFRRVILTLLTFIPNATQKKHNPESKMIVQKLLAVMTTCQIYIIVIQCMYGLLYFMYISHCTRLLLHFTCTTGQPVLRTECLRGRGMWGRWGCSNCSHCSPSSTSDLGGGDLTVVTADQLHCSPSSTSDLVGGGVRLQSP